MDILYDTLTKKVKQKNALSPAKPAAWKTARKRSKACSQALSTCASHNPQRSHNPPPEPASAARTPRHLQWQSFRGKRSGAKTRCDTDVALCLSRIYPDTIVMTKRVIVTHPLFPLLPAGIFLGIFLKLFVIDIFMISGPSMHGTLDDGKIIAVNKLWYGICKPFSDTLLVSWKAPQRGDIIVYLLDNKVVVKRCVAVAGDALEFDADSGYTVKTAGLTIPLTDFQYAMLHASEQVPHGTVFAVGDNYAESVDSRNYGFVSTKNILGRVFFR
ncbi:MAG: hypothetical protein Ta2A_05770 [Treponemataceae bacterium]|nr:MAG: hypothetical protein Ta2A_05770 [Treponemataceae bacterium]